MNSRFYRLFAHPKLSSYLAVGNIAIHSCQKCLYTAVESRSTFICVLFYEAFERKMDHGQRPAAFKEFLRGEEVRPVRAVITLGAVHFQRNDGHPAAALLRLLAIPFISQEMIQ